MTNLPLRFPVRSGKPLALLADAAKALEVCTRVDVAKGIRDAAIAFETYAKAAKDTVLVERATEVRFRAETKAGALLHDMAVQRRREIRGGDRRSKGHRVTLKLADLGITNMESKRWQKLAAQKLAFPEIWQAQLQRLCRMAVAVTEGDKAVIAAARADQHAEKKRQRDRHERELAEKIYALPAQRFGVIYADPPWKFQTWSDKGLTNTSADNHYATSDISEIQALDVDSIAAADCALFLWATVPMLPHALETMTAWGSFNYRSHCIWKKNRIGTGFIFLNCHEILLYGTRGNVPAPGTQWPSVIEADVAAHSVKPEIFLEMIEQYFPTLPKIELYRRGPARPGWSAWGAEVESTEEVA